MKYCDKLNEELTNKVQNKFAIICRSDPKRSGRFEVTLFRTHENLLSETNGKLIHSKASTGGFPDYSENSSFMKELKTFWNALID